MECFVHETARPRAGSCCQSCLLALQGLLSLQTLDFGSMYKSKLFTSHSGVSVYPCLVLLLQGNIQRSVYPSLPAVMAAAVNPRLAGDQSGSCGGLRHCCSSRVRSNFQACLSLLDLRHVWGQLACLQDASLGAGLPVALYDELWCL